MFGSNPQPCDKRPFTVSFFTFNAVHVTPGREQCKEEEKKVGESRKGLNETRKKTHGKNRWKVKMAAGDDDTLSLSLRNKTNQKRSINYIAD